MLNAPDQLSPTSRGRVTEAPGDETSLARTMNISALWNALEELRASYTCGAAKPAEAFARIRAGLHAIDVQALKLQHPHVEEIIVVGRSRGECRGRPDGPPSADRSAGSLRVEQVSAAHPASLVCNTLVLFQVIVPPP